jgi:hypothetical protein
MAETENNAWYYWWSSKDHKWYILAFLNKGKSYSRRQFQVTDGKLLAYQHDKGKCEVVFAKDLQAPSLHFLGYCGPVDWPDGLPPEILSGLWKRIIAWVVELPPSQQ